MPSAGKDGSDCDYRDGRFPGRGPGGEDEPFPILWVGNLSVDTLDYDLMSLFAKHGVLDCVMTFSSRNFAFLYFKHAGDAKAAKDDLQGALVRGNSIRIEFARPAKPCKQLWIGGLSPSVTKEQLEEEFSKFGKIEDHKFNRERNSALIEFYRVDDAASALKNMDGKDLGGEKIRVDYLRSGSQYSKKDSSEHPSRFLPDAARHSSSGSYDGPASRILSIRYPPSVRFDEQMLHHAMILFGEIDQVKIFPSRCTAFVEFRSVEEARRAKEGLTGRLFNDSRIQILYSNDESFSFGQGPRQDSFFPDHPFGRTKYSHCGYPNMPSMGRPQFPQRGFFDGGSSDFHKGVNFSRLSPTPGNLWDAGYDGRDAKRSRTEGSPFDDVRRMDGPIMRNHPYGMNGPDRVGAGPGPGPSSPFGAKRPAPAFPSRDHCWRGVIAKGGTLVCHARCVPVGKGIESPLPEVVNCSARTGLDMLSKHYEEADGFDIVFFLPDSEDDFASYTEFLQYLRLKNRAGVAKLEDGTTLFLVPPSDFLTHILKVNGPERLYGVVLKIPQQIPAVERQQTPDVLPRVDYGISSQSTAPRPLTSQPVEVSLTPELIATLAAVIPVPAGAAPLAAQSQQGRTYTGGQSQQPGVLSSMPTSGYLMSQQNAPQSHADADFGSNRGYGLTPQMSQQAIVSQRANQEFPTQLQQMQTNPHPTQLQQMQTNPQSSNQLPPSEGEADKNQRYQSTLQLAANLLLQIQQQQKQTSSQSVQGSGGHQ